MLFAFWHVIYIYGWSVVESVESKTWLWGDSQAFTGIEQEHWQGDKPLFSQAQHGNGFQDLVLFSDRLPENTETLIAFGPLYYRVNNDRNQGGLSSSGLLSIYEAWQSPSINISLPSSILNNVRKEFSVKSILSTEHSYYGDSNKVGARTWYLKNIDSLCRSIPLDPVFTFKDKWLVHSLDVVHQKSEVLHLFVFPMVDEVSATSFSRVEDHYHLMLDSLARRYQLKRDTIRIEFEGYPYYDATHLMHSSAKTMTAKLSEEMKGKNSSSIIVVEYDYPAMPSAAVVEGY